MVKNFVLDTNILLLDPECILNGFDDNTVIITGTSLQELDSKKKAKGEVGYNARECCRILDEIRKQGDLLQGVKNQNGGLIKIEPDGVRQEYLPDGYSIQSADNRIISTCIHLQKMHMEIILVTNDISMRVNAAICGIPVEEYRNSMIDESGYSGHTDLEVSEKMIDQIFDDLAIPAPEDADLETNEFVTLHAGGRSALSIHQNGYLNLIKDRKLFGGVMPKNAMQSYAIWALSAPVEEIPLVILLGPAGTAKTFLSLAVGLDQTYTSQSRDGRYSKIMISRPTAESFQEIGFLPGGLDDKLAPLLASYYDNLEILLNRSGKESRDQIRMHMDDLLESGVVEICGLNFIRGRSLVDTYLICDEAQNASSTLIRDVITRAGKGTKVVIAGDPNQIDVPILDKRNNGLVYAAENMKGSPLAAIIAFSEGNSVRSKLSREAVERLRN